MKKIVYITSFILLFTCNSEDAGDCFQTSGNLIQQEVTIEAFEKILVNRDIKLVVKQDVNYKVVIETGKNLMNDVKIKVINDQLILNDDNTCNYVRDYGITTIYVSAPNVTEIRSSTQYDIVSEGVLNYSSLRLLSEDFNVPDTFTIGDFRLEINSANLNITANGLSSFYISGTVENANIGFYAGSGRFEGRNLLAQNVEVYHRGSNTMIVNPQLSLTGQLLGTGDLISVNQPSIVDVEVVYTGNLIFE
ncbi:head GIN domain-containing protein [Yeosuana sp. MJ-SS3]|jgi:hypothetical protein|uniref:Head GIN domain-containing protein n=1 Tax=Gilvirhabdus luticola TaxID=3079858 RepID=A0ABU3U5U0_9FLAO|nr:head GIN domain-containing protein [Yeosuana sp. MJ-SS3]MDU8885787.1 head GIN domain-containing protein [Yeosuana sp. MJ-SS3]